MLLICRHIQFFNHEHKDRKSVENNGVTKRPINSDMLGIPPDLHETEQAKNLETKTDNRNDLLQNQISTSQSFPDTQSLPKLSPRGSYFMNKIIYHL